LRRVNDLQRIAEMLYPDPPNVDPFLDRLLPDRCFSHCALFVRNAVSAGDDRRSLRQGMASDDEGFGQHWKRVIEGRQSGNRRSPRNASGRLRCH